MTQKVLEIVGFFRWHETLDTGQQFFLRQVVEGDLRRCFWNTDHVFGSGDSLFYRGFHDVFRLIHFNMLLQGVDQVLFQVAR